jgi:hypothetical protein
MENATSAWSGQSRIVERVQAQEPCKVFVWDEFAGEELRETSREK